MEQPLPTPRHKRRDASIVTLSFRVSEEAGGSQTL